MGPEPPASQLEVVEATRRSPEVTNQMMTCPGSSKEGWATFHGPDHYHSTYQTHQQPGCGGSTRSSFRWQLSEDVVGEKEGNALHAQCQQKEGPSTSGRSPINVSLVIFIFLHLHWKNWGIQAQPQLDISPATLDTKNKRWRQSYLYMNMIKKT